MNIYDFNLEPPVVMMGIVKVQEEVKIHFNSKASIEKSYLHANEKNLPKVFARS